MLLRRCVPAATALMLVLSTAQARAQSDQDKAAARSLATQAAESFTAGKLEETIDLLRRAEALVHAPTHLLLMARAQVRLGRYVAAKETYLKIVREELASNAPSAFKKAQQDGREELAAIDPKIASLRIALDGAAGRKINVLLDGQPVAEALLGVHRPIDPGTHAIAVQAPGLGPIEQSVTLAEGEKKDVTIPIPPGPSAPPSPDGAATGPNATLPVEPGAPPLGDGQRSRNPVMLGAGIGGMVLGLGGVVVGAVFLAKSGSTQDESNTLFSESNCAVKNDACDERVQSRIQSLDNDAASQKSIGAVGLIGGGVLLAVGTTLVVLELTAKPKENTGAWIAPYLTAGGLGVRGAF